MTIKSVRKCAVLFCQIFIMFCICSKPLFSQSISDPYLGQSPPGLTPQLFPTEKFLSNAEWFWHGPLSFSPDGGEIYMTKYLNGDLMQLNIAKVENGIWSDLEAAPFASESDENNPFIHINGRTLFFISGRPGERFWKVEKTDTGWTEAVGQKVPTPKGGKGYGWQMSVSRDQSIYFDYMMSNGFEVFVSRYRDGVYGEPERLPANVNNGEAFCPYIDPDERYLLFCSMRQGSIGGFDIYISFRSEDGEWQDPVNLGDSINTAGTEMGPYVTIDGNYLFFFSRRENDTGYNPYWVETEVINNLKLTN